MENNANQTCEWSRPVLTVIDISATLAFKGSASDFTVGVGTSGF